MKKSCVLNIYCFCNAFFQKHTQTSSYNARVLICKKYLLRGLVETKQWRSKGWLGGGFVSRVAASERRQVVD